MLKKFFTVLSIMLVGVIIPVNANFQEIPQIEVIENNKTLQSFPADNLHISAIMQHMRIKSNPVLAKNFTSAITITDISTANGLDIKHSINQANPNIKTISLAIMSEKNQISFFAIQERKQTIKVPNDGVYRIFILLLSTNSAIDTNSVIVQK